MTEPNPYAPPKSDNDLAATEQPSIYVEGKYLVVTSGVVLPKRCVKTNQSLGENASVTQKLQWRGRSFQLISRAKECEITWYATPLVRFGNLVPKIGNYLMAGLYIAYAFLGPQIPATSWGVMGLTLLYLFVLLTCRPPLRVARYENGRFWIEGCGPEYLDQLRNELTSHSESQLSL